MPFYVFHQPVIIVVAYYVVQWGLPAPAKMLIVGLAAFAATLGICELLIRSIAPLRTAFGVKARQQ